MRYYKSFKLTSFTLVEMTATILITSIVSVYAVPRLMNTDNFKTAIFLKQIYNSLLYAQGIAMGSGCHINVNISANNLTLKLRSNCNNGTFTLDIQDPFYKKIYYTQTAPINTTIQTNNFPIYFDNTGQSRLISTGNIADSTINITGNNLQENISITGANGSIDII